MPWGKKGLLHLVTLRSHLMAVPHGRNVLQKPGGRNLKQRPWRSAVLLAWVSLLSYTIQGHLPKQWPGPSHDTSTTKKMSQRLAFREIWGLHHISCPDHSDERNNKGKPKNLTISETRERRRWAAQSHRQAVRKLYSRRLKVAGPSYLEGHTKRFLKPTIWKIRARIRHVRHDRNMKLGD